MKIIPSRIKLAFICENPKACEMLRKWLISESVTQLCCDDLTAIGISSEQILQIAKVVAGTHVDTIDFSNNNFGNHAIEIARIITEETSKIQNVFMAHNELQVQVIDVAKMFTRESSSIKYVSFRNNDIGEHGIELAQIMSHSGSKIESLDLSDNDLGVQCIKIAQMLAITDSPIKSVDLGHNCLNKDDEVKILNILTSLFTPITSYLPIQNISAEHMHLFEFKRISDACNIKNGSLMQISLQSLLKALKGQSNAVYFEFLKKIPDTFWHPVLLQAGEITMDEVIKQKDIYHLIQEKSDPKNKLPPSELIKMLAEYIGYLNPAAPVTFQATTIPQNDSSSKKRERQEEGDVQAPAAKREKKPI